MDGLGPRTSKLIRDKDRDNEVIHSPFRYVVMSLLPLHRHTLSPDKKARIDLLYFVDCDTELSCQWSSHLCDARQYHDMDVAYAEMHHIWKESFVIESLIVARVHSKAIEQSRYLRQVSE